MQTVSNLHLTDDDASALAGASKERIAPEFENFQDPRKVFHHIDRIFELRTTGDTRPIHLSIGLTNYCAHKCPWCYINWHQSGRASERSGAGDRSRKAINASRRLIDAVGEAVELGLKAVTIVGDGEPTMHPNFAEILEQLSAMGVDIGVFTNFSTNDPAVLEAMAQHCFFVRASIDAASAVIHSRTHGSEDFDQVIANLKRIIKLRGGAERPVIGAQFVTNHWNVWQLPDAARFFRDIGVDYLTIKPAYKNVLNPAHPENELDSEEAFRLMKKAKDLTTDTFKVFAKLPQFKEVVGHKTNGGRYYAKCYATPLSPYLDEDGSVEMCGNLKGCGFTLGNIHESSFKEIWTSGRRLDCLSRINLDKCPSGCRLDPLNKVLWDAFHPEENEIHPNFV